MKRSTLIFPALAAALFVTGCNIGGGVNYDKVSRVVETKESSDDGVLITKYEYDAWASEIKQTRTTDSGTLVYEIKDYTWSSNDEGYPVCTRKRTNADGSVHTLATTYGYLISSGDALETQYEEKAADGTTVKKTETKYNSIGVSEFTEYGPGGTTKVLERKNYDYSGSSQTQTYDEIRNGGEPVRICAKIIRTDYSGNVLEYEIWSGWVSDSNKGTKIEEKTDYISNESSSSWKINKWDAEGIKTTTSFTNKIEIITVEY